MQDANKSWLKDQTTEDLKKIVIEWIELDIEKEEIYLMNEFSESEAGESILWLGNLNIPEKPTFSWAKRIYERNEDHEESYSWNEYSGIGDFQDVYFSYDELDLVVNEIKSRGEYGVPALKK